MRYPDYLVHYNKNHDKKTGRFTFGDGNGDGVSPDNYKTPELDRKYSELEKSGVFKFNTIKPVGNTGDAEKEWGKEIVNATDVGIKALNKTRYKGEFNDYDLLDDVDKNGERHWFLFDDQTYGMPELAYLVNKGWSKDKIIDAFKTSSDLRDVNSKYEDDYLANKNVTFNDKNWYETYKEADKSSPYKGIWNIAEGYNRMDYSGELDKYIDACIEVSKEIDHSDMGYSNYLIHFNKNHDPKSGRFTFGDGDGKINKKDKKPYSFDYYDYSKDHIERVNVGKFKTTREIYTDKNGQKHELKLLESVSNGHMKRKYGSERDSISRYARSKSEDVELHRNASLAYGISAGLNFVNSASMFYVGAVAPGGALAGVAALQSAKSLIEEQKAKKIDDGLMNMSINEIKEYKNNLKETKKAIAT